MRHQSNSSVSRGMFALLLVIAGAQAACLPEGVAEASGPMVTGLNLINVPNGKAVTGFNPIKDGSTIALSALPSRQLSIQAVTSPSTVGSVY
ncbi:MAG TPA: hypothetical protein VL588_02130, partial [Bdellovibrionota bacterium]|nr:hypothetical protein [Bdellovibrionota bacterium]